MIKLACDQVGGRFWGDAARWAAWSYNTSYNATSGTTPYYAVPGREPRQIGDAIFADPAASDPISLVELIRRIRKIHKFVSDRIEHMQDSYIRHNAKMVRNNHFATNDRVWPHRVFPGNQRAGTDRAWYWPFRPEPYTIIDAMSEQHVRIRRCAAGDGDSGPIQVVSTRRLKPYRPQADAFGFTGLLPHINTDAGPQ